ncbi:MAG: LysM peptidoglycan-binding domain-containing protein [Acidobacteriota bacterium]
MRWLRVLPVFILLLASQPAWAQDDTKGAESRDFGWYIVRPADTLRGLAARFLGSEDRWQEVWKLNQDIVDADRIYPRQKIRLPLPTKTPATGALVRQLANRVEDQPTPLSWNDAQENEVLRARDGLRTFESASADLVFPDQTRLVVTEKSTIFIGEEAPAQEAVDRTQIEIVLGQADLEGASVSADTSQFEIVLGDAKATPRASGNQAVQTRARRVGEGAQLMVYSGESQLAAAGAELTVGTGMGSSVAEGEPPTPPEKLLPAAEGLVPEAGARLATPRPTFHWQPVDGARSYTLEICRDPRCGALFQRVQELTEPSWAPDKLPVEQLYWRVTAVSPSGLDGYPTSGRGFEILSAVEDRTPPGIRIAFTGPQRVAPRQGLNEHWIVGPGMAIEVEVDDNSSGVESWTPSIDGEAIAPAALQGPWVDGEHTVGVAVTDRAGNRNEREKSFVYDSEPPRMSWGREGAAASGRSSNEPGEGLEGSGPVMRGRREIRIGKHTWEIDSDLGQIRLRLVRGKSIAFEGLGSLGYDEGLWILAEDAVCPDLENLAYELEAGDRRGDLVLRYEATDCVGNTRRGRLPLTKQKK